MAFISSYMYSLDTKKRILVPNKFRDELGDTFYVTRSLDKCLTVYTEEEWNLFLANLKSIPSTTSAIAMEYFMSAAQKCTPDGSGRILLDDKLIEYAKIGKNAVFVGAGNKRERQIAIAMLFSVCFSSTDFKIFRKGLLIFDEYFFSRIGTPFRVH